LLGPFIDHQREKLMLRMLQGGSISRAEYEEEMGKSKPGKVSVRQ
jgi:hypothetical protein